MLDDARIGIDIGRVIMAATDARGRADTSFLQGSDANAMRTPPNDGAFSVIRELVARANGNVWLVSKAGPRIQALTRKWLAHWSVFEKTGLPEGHVRFCLERRDKAVHATELRLSDFIDDRIDVHQHLHGIVPRLYLFGHQRSGTVVPRWLTHVVTWDDVRRADRSGHLHRRSPRQTREDSVPKIEPSQVWIPVVRGHLALAHRPKMTALAGLRGQGCTAMLTCAAIGAAASRVGIEWIWLPLDGGDPPSDERDGEVRRTFDHVRDLLMGGGHVLIHCSAGIHRTGMVGYALLRHLGLPQEGAKAILRSLRTVTAEGVGELRLEWGERFDQAGVPSGNTM